MYSFYLFFTVCFSHNYPETKTLRGNLFTWPSSLASSRKMWKWFTIPTISFNFTDINLTQITEQYLLKDLEFNLNDQIKEWLEILSESYYFELPNFEINPKHYKTIKAKSAKCDSNKYPNVALILNGNSGNFDCQKVEDTFGQIFSYFLIVMPLFVIVILSLVFYSVFAVGRFFWFKPKSKIKPNKYEIIAFSFISFFLFLTVIFNFTGSIYFIKKLKYVFNKGMANDLADACVSMSNSMVSEMQESIDQFFPTFDGLIATVTDYINEGTPKFIDLILRTDKKSSAFINTVRNIERFIEKYNTSLQNVEKSYQNCAQKSSSDSELISYFTSKSSHLSSRSSSLHSESFLSLPLSDSQNDSCPSEISLFKNINFKESHFEIKKFIEEVSFQVQVLNCSEYIDEVRIDLIEIINNMRNDIKNQFNVSELGFFDNMKCDMNDTFEFIDNIPSYVVPLTTTILVLTPIFMLLTLAAQVYSFWYSGKFSRVCSSLCIPQSFCMIIQLFIGSFASICCLFVIFYGTIYNQGDDVIDSVLKGITNDERVIHFGEINATYITDGVIGSFMIDDIQIRRIEFVKKLMDAKLKTKMSEVFNMNDLPFEDISELINNTANKVVSSAKLYRSLFDPVTDGVIDSIRKAPMSDLRIITSVYDLNINLSKALKNVTCCESEKTKLYNEYKSFMSEFNNQSASYSNGLMTYRTQAFNFTTEIAEVSTDFLGSFLRKFGSAFSSAVKELKPVFGSFDISSAIGSINIVRSKFLHPFEIGCIYLSISAHLYVIAMVLMSMLLWFRRRGMGNVESYDNLLSESSGSVFSNLITEN